MTEAIDFRKCFSRLGMLTVLAVFLLLFGFGSTPASANTAVPPWDKLVHFGVFSILTFGLRAWLVRLPWYVVMLLVTAIGASDELHQHYVPGRYPGWDDLAADAAGAVFACLLWPVFERIIRRCISASALPPG